MIILKIKDKGLYVEIPGALPTRTPADIDISKCNLAVVDMYLRKSGISNYQIMSVEKKNVTLKPSDIPNGSIDQKVINKRFTKLEQMVSQLISDKAEVKKENSEQITNKLDKLEALATKLLEKKSQVIEKVVTQSNSPKIKKAKKLIKEPEIEELEDKYIPDIDISNMKMKTASKKAIKQENIDLDDNADLLSRIMGQDD